MLFSTSTGILLMKAVGTFPGRHRSTLPADFVD
jgi:hypothetical protein